MTGGVGTSAPGGDDRPDAGGERHRGDEVIVVTGGGRGIGAAISKLAAHRGYAVMVNYAHDAAAAEQVVAEIEAAGGRASAMRGDVAREADVVALFTATDERLGRVTALVNNAGVTGGLVRVDAIEAEALAGVLAVNVTGAFLCAREAIRRMSTRFGGRGGAIVNLSSMAARLGGGGEWVHYAASKGAIETFTIGLAREVAAEGVRVNAVAPGLIETEIHAAAGAPERLERLAGSVPMRRAGSAMEVAECVLWLLSPAASYVTGAVLPVGGGR